MARNEKAQLVEDFQNLAASGVFKSSQQPLRGPPAEGLKPLGSILDRAARVQRVYGGDALGGGTFPNPFADTFPAFSLRNMLLDAGIDVTQPGNPLLGGYGGGNFRGGSVSGTGQPTSGTLGQAKGFFGLSPTDRRALRTVGAIPGLGLPSFTTRAIHRLFGPQFGVVGAETIAPRIGDPAFGRTIRGGSFGSNRGVGSRGGGFGHFGGPR